MSLYGKLSVRGLVSPNADYSAPDIDTRQADLVSAPTKFVHEMIPVSVAGVTLDLTAFTVVNGLVLINHSVTAGQTVSALWKQITGSFGPGDIQLGDGGGICAFALDTLSGGTLGALAAAATWMDVSAAMTAANNVSCLLSTHYASEANCFVVSASNPAGEFPNPVAHDTAAVLTFYNKAEAQLSVNGGQYVASPGRPGGTLTLTAAAGTPSVEVFVMGT